MSPRMRATGRYVVLLPLILLLAGAAPDTGPLAARASADVILVREGEVVDEDLYAGANTVTIEGRIEGDLVVWALDRLDISGTVEGDVIGYASHAAITGTIGGSVRLAGIDLDVEGTTGGDFLAFGWKVAAAGTIGHDLLAWANTLDVAGEVGRDVEGQTLGRTRVSGSVGRDVQVTVGSLVVTAGADVGQDLIYQASSVGRIDPQATVGGTTIRRAPTLPNIRVSAVRAVAVVLAILAFLWIGLLTVWMLPETMRRATVSVTSRPVRTFLVGVAAFLVPILLAGLALAVAILSPPDLTLTLLAIGMPLWLGLLVMLLVGLIVAPVPVAIVVGRRIVGRRRSAFASYLVGILLYTALWFVPVLGVPLALLVMVVGLGALARGAVGARGSLRWAAGETAPGAHRRRRVELAGRRMIEPEPGEGDWTEPPTGAPGAEAAVEEAAEASGGTNERAAESRAEDVPEPAEASVDPDRERSAEG